MTNPAIESLIHELAGHLTPAALEAVLFDLTAAEMSPDLAHLFERLTCQLVCLRGPGEPGFSIDRHPLSSQPDFRQISQDVQHCRASWPIGIERVERCDDSL